MCYFPLRLSVLFHIYVFHVPCICQRTADFTWHTQPHILSTQSKPLIPLQKEEDPETQKTVLTNYMFPQQIRIEECE